jgi:hypothetical protein
MNAIITDKYNWNAHKTNKNDRRIAKDLLKAFHSSDFDQDAKKEILTEIRYLLGFKLPEDCLFLVKSYLLLPRDVFLSKQKFWNYAYDLPGLYLRLIAYDDLSDHQITLPKKIKQTDIFKTVISIADKFPSSENIYQRLSVSADDYDETHKSCDVNNCWSQDNLSVKPMYYRKFRELNCSPVMKQYICKSCIDIGYHLGQCLGCSEYYSWDKLTLQLGIGFSGFSLYEYRNFFCKSCVTDINNRINC